MLRWFVTILVCLALGAVVNVAVAWGIEASTDRQSRAHLKLVIAELKSRVANPGFVDPGDIADKVPALYFASPQVTRTMQYHQGWPLDSLQHRMNLSIPNAGTRQVSFEHGIVLSLRITAGKTLALKPVLPGFLINTILYAALAYGAMCSASAIRRRLRRRSHQCAHCRYDLSGAMHERCPECGSTTEIADDSVH